MNTNGKFIISLDFELLWGVRDIQTLDTYGNNILGVWDAVPKMLETFRKHKVAATWATVGFLFASSKKELLEFCPVTKPNYSDKNLSPYNGHFDIIGKNEGEDKYHFASTLIHLIKNYPNQEIATHTYSHYYCLEHGQTAQDFYEDIKASIRIANNYNISMESLVFPRNQFNNEYLQIIKELGIKSYRGNEKAWFFNSKFGQEEKTSKRALRLLDSYLNISGHNCYTIEEISKKEPFNIPSSRFLRPYSSKLKLFESLRLKRILSGMSHAAKTGKIYHLWWHPHNFGQDQKQNFDFLNKILTHYAHLNKKYNFESVTMGELSRLIKKKHA